VIQPPAWKIFISQPCKFISFAVKIFVSIVFYISVFSISIFSVSALAAEVSARASHNRNNDPDDDSQAQAKKNTARQALRPALVAPPDAMVTDDSINDAQSDQAKHEPIPQIKKKKETVDPRFHSETQYIEHPNASKGLIRIDKDKIYYYKVKTSDQTKAGTFHMGTYTPTNLANPDDSSLSFNNLYDQTSFPILLYDHEWQILQMFGKFALKAGGGFYYATGHGKFEIQNDNRADSPEPKEKFTLLVFPINVGLIYRLKYFKNQWLVPYVEGGIDAFCFAETRDDDQNPALGAALGLSPAAHFSLGGSLSLGKNARSFLDLDREYGINAMYLTLEYRNYVSLSNKYDFSGDAVTAGITAEY
jgi:hypothetical protein